MRRFLFFLFLVTSLFATNPYVAKDFSGLIGQIPGLADELIRMHLTLYEGYVKNINLITDGLKKLQALRQEGGVSFGALKKQWSWEYDGMILHELYFENLAPGGRALEDGPLLKKITDTFKTLDSFKREFKNVGMIRGIGWVVLTCEPIQGNLVINWIDEHNIGELVKGKTLLVMDVWEHAYITQFGLDRGRYIDIFLNNINWDVVTKRVEQSSKKSSLKNPSIVYRKN